MALKKVTEDITSYGNLIDETTGGSSRTFLAGTYTTNKGGTVILYENGDYIYTPPADLYGSDYFFYTQYKTNNKGVVTESSVKGAFSITSVNDIPVAVDDKFSTKESTVLTGNVLQDNGHGADHDVETATLKAVAGTFATTQGGSVKITSTGNFTYTPPAGFHGIDSFTYQAKDGANATDTGNVTIIVKSVIDVIATVTDNQYSAPDDQDYRINGLNTADVIVGGAGNDIIQGFAGVDNIQGGSGDDEIHGGSGDDTIYGDDGNDTLLGEGGADIIYGGAGDDFIGGDVGFTAGMNDMLYGGDGNDTIEGRAGDDTIEGGAGNDMLYGGIGNDIISGGADDDTAYGDDGDDHIFGGDGIDKLFGDAGNDTIYGDAGDDFLRGGTGDDELHGGDGNDDIRGNEDNDLLYGDAGNDLLYGGTGNDELHGGIGNDALAGEDGNDVMYGDAGNDIMRGGDGNDTIYGGDGADQIFGDDGDDTIISGAGADALYGGAGSDTFVYNVADLNSGYDKIGDFQAGPGGDKIDISNLLSGYDPLTDDINDFIKAFAYSDGTAIQVDRDGAGTQFGWQAVLLTRGTGDLGDAQHLIDNENLIV